VRCNELFSLCCRSMCIQFVKSASVLQCVAVSLVQSVAVGLFQCVTDLRASSL